MSTDASRRINTDSYGKENSCFPPPKDIFTPMYPTKVLKDINWTVYSPANPPPSGSYIVIAINKYTKDKDFWISIFNADEYRWCDVEDACRDSVVTHYAKLEFP